MVIILFLLFILLYFINSNITSTNSENNIPVSSSPIEDQGLVYRTPWPPTEAQQACNSRLSLLRKDPAKSKLLGAVYCGGTGKYIGTDASGNRYVVESEVRSGENSNSNQSNQQKTDTFSSIPDYYESPTNNSPSQNDNYSPLSSPSCESIKQNYLNEYQSALSNEQSRYSTTANQLSSSLMTLGINGAGDSSMADIIRDKQLKNYEQYQSTYNTLRNTYIQNISNLSC